MTKLSLQPGNFVPTDAIRSAFAAAMSSMYRSEVPQYGTLVDMVGRVNAVALRASPALMSSGHEERARLDVERHGAIRVGTPEELATMRRVFRVMGMAPVGYYDLSAAGVPVHSTAFRPVTAKALAENPFRVFTSLLRLDLIDDGALRESAARILRHRRIFTPRALLLVEQFELLGGLLAGEAEDFVNEVLETFRWHGASTVSQAEYQRLHDAHRLIADVVCFRGPHINHLTPRTLDIDAAQAEMPRRGIVAKDVIEGPPRRLVPILLRQTSFKALEESVRFSGQREGAHTARFGEVEQRGMALTRAGRALYDHLLGLASEFQGRSDYPARLQQAFKAFPDDLEVIRRQGLGFFRYTLAEGVRAGASEGRSLDDLVADGVVHATPITYEDFLPVSAAGIFQSNLGHAQPQRRSAGSARAQFEESLGSQVLDEFALYESEQVTSLRRVLHDLRSKVTA